MTKEESKPTPEEIAEEDVDSRTEKPENQYSMAYKETLYKNDKNYRVAVDGSEVYNDIVNALWSP